MQINQTAKGAWQIAAAVTNKHDTWIEIRTFYGVGDKEALARYYNTVFSMGWEMAE
jgi:hypothetical protein